MLVVETLPEVAIKDATGKRMKRKDVKAEFWESGHVKGETGVLGQNPGNLVEQETQISKRMKLLLHRVKFPECVGGVRVSVSRVLEFNSTEEQGRLSPGETRGQQSEKPPDTTVSTWKKKTQPKS